MADLRKQDEIDALSEEFVDRFGPLPEETQNLFYQLKVKLLAEKAGLASISIESGQIVLRYPPLPEGETSRAIPELDGDMRIGKNTIWMPFNGPEDWKEKLLRTLSQLAPVGEQV
jgi:transcription-repair coupling factor (superfamily II helicase)